MNPGLPGLDVEEVGDRAREVARTHLEALHRQDEREQRLLAGDTDGANRAAERALAGMATTYVAEFPDLPPARARAAGRTFMRALFLQDEIENWPQLREREGLGGVMVSDPRDDYGQFVTGDDRWTQVTAMLRTVCSRAGIDEEYADAQTRFWRLHGLRDDDWPLHARRAQRIKLRAMVDASQSELDDLAAYFVASVRVHDRWSHADRSRDLAALVDIVARYYQHVFDLRGAE